MGAGKNKRKGRKSKGKTISKDAPQSGDADDGDALLAEEITALSAIFQDDFNLISEHPFKEFSINLRPHYDYNGDFSAQLFVRCLPGYPWKPPKLQIVIKNELLEPESRLLHSMLVEQAASTSREGRVMVFNLAEAAQEYLSECLTNLAAHQQDKDFTTSPGTAENGLSMFSSMKDLDTVESEDLSTRHVLCDLWGDHDGTWEGPDSGSSEQLHIEKEVPLTGQHTSLHSAGLDTSPTQAAVVLPQRKQMVPDIQDGVKTTDAPKAGDLQSLEEEGKDEVEASSKDPHTTSVAEFLQKLRSGLFRMGRAMKHSVLLERSSRGDVDKIEEVSATSPSSQDETIHSIQKDLILGHLLRLVCGKRGPLPDTLPILAAQISKLGIIPSWAEDLVTQQPQLFEATFKQMFANNMWDKPGISEFQARKDVLSFWNASPKLLGEGDSSSGATSSRYLSDFEELCLLGKGGFGHVVLCKNKLDGRRYAMKKVRLKDKNLSVNDKILREVATLSRLQHQHVVRYYQAWFETAMGNLVGMVDGFSEEFESSAGWIDTTAATNIRKEEFHAINADNEDAVSVTFLYIQMEYCPRTLKEVFDTYSGPLDKDVTWRIFRQIVEGLAHIHGQGIIHRDLTPSNIFFDARNEIKIGDFGLAKFTDLENPDRDNVPGYTETNTGSIDGTGQVGTYFYRAPEVEQGWPHIDEKVDMYSVGVILFELWHPFSTAMERYVILSDLKQQGVLPSDWVVKYPQQASLVKLLLTPHPHDRPSAREVLRSELVPPRMEDEALKDILRTIQSGENSFVFDQVIAAIFDEERIAVKAERMERDTASLKRKDLDYHSIKWLKGQERIVEIAKEVFTRHRAQNFESISMSVIADLERLNRRAAKVISSSGSMLELRYDTRRPFARWVVINQCTSLKRYEISHVYRRGVGHSAPNEYLQGDFDIVGGSRGLAEAEAIKVAIEIVSKLPDIETYEVRLNHHGIVNAIWSWSGVTRQLRRKVAQILATKSFPQSSDRKSRWVLVRRQLLQGLQLPEAVVDKLQTAERRFTGNADEVLARLRGALSHSVSCLSAIEELSRLLSYLRVWHVESLVMVDVFMAPAEDYFDGIFFQMYLPKGSHPGTYSEGMLFAVGGRYDSLLEQLCGDYRFSTIPGAVGLSVALQKLVYIAKADSKVEPATEVLVCSRGGGGLLKERMEVADELWTANVKADYVSATAPSLTEQYEYAHENGIKWLVIITESGLSQTGLVKLRHLDLKAEVDVPREGLGKFFTEMTSAPLNLKKRAAMLRHGS